MFNEDDTEAVLMVDASNAFNSINREAFLYNTKVLCPALATFISNLFNTKWSICLIGKRLKSLERMTQGDPATMAIYALGVTLLLTWLGNSSKEKFPRQVAFADDLNGVGSLENL